MESKINTHDTGDTESAPSESNIQGEEEGQFSVSAQLDLTSSSPHRNEEKKEKNPPQNILMKNLVIYRLPRKHSATRDTQTNIIGVSDALLLFYHNPAIFLSYCATNNNQN